MISVRLQALKNSGKKKLAVIPFLMTFANAFLGLVAVLYAIEGQYNAAALSILAAAFFDCLDGRTARKLGSTSLLGMELDSLCDAVSFCFAPAIILYSWKLYSLKAVGLLVVGFYLCSGLFRLARFNLLDDESKKSYFVGLATTVTASWIASLVLASNWLQQGKLAFIVKPQMLAFLIIFVAVLMSSYVRFPAFKNKRNWGMNTYAVLAAIFISSLYVVATGGSVVFSVISSYILSSIVIDLLRVIKERLF